MFRAILIDDEPWALESLYRGFRWEESGFEVIKSGGAADGQIQAMTGATITSQAVTDAVNLAVEKYQTLEKGGN